MFKSGVKQHHNGLLGLSVLLLILFWGIQSDCSGIIFHPDDEPPSQASSWPSPGRPADDVMGAWNANASCVAISSNHVITTSHQIDPTPPEPNIVSINGTNYLVADTADVTSDIRIARITTIDGQLANLSSYADISTRLNLNNQVMVIAGIGKIRGSILQTGGITYGYGWATNPGNAMNWGRNIVWGYNTDYIQSTFDGSGDGDHTYYECTAALNDSGGGFFIFENPAWKLAGITHSIGYFSGVTPHSNETWFKDPSNPTQPQPDLVNAYRLRQYNGTIDSIITPPATPGFVSATTGSGCGEINLSWPAVSGANGYRVYYRQGSSGPPFTPASINPVTGTSTVISGLTPGTTYYFAVTSFQGIAESDYSSQDMAVSSSNNCPLYISGFVIDNAQGLEGVLVSADNGGGSDVTNSGGFYQLEVPYSWTGNVTASKDGYVFSPSNISFLNLTANIGGQNFISDPILKDDFNDNLRSSDWRYHLNAPYECWLYEMNNRLEFQATYSSPDAAAIYSSNGWRFDTQQDFSLKIDFHHDLVSVLNNYLFVLLKADDGSSDYCRFSVGSESSQKYWDYESKIGGASNSQSIVRNVNDGTLYISYKSDSNSLYLSYTDYGPTNAWQTITELFTGQQAELIIGGYSYFQGVQSSEAYFDNFAINTGNLIGWPPITDIYQDGFIDVLDLLEISDQWLFTPSDLPIGQELTADIILDNIVDFLDYAEFSNAW